MSNGNFGEEYPYEQEGPRRMSAIDRRCLRIASAALLATGCGTLLVIRSLMDQVPTVGVTTTASDLPTTTMQDEFGCSYQGDRQFILSPGDFETDGRVKIAQVVEAIDSSAGGDPGCSDQLITGIDTFNSVPISVRTDLPASAVQDGSDGTYFIMVPDHIVNNA